MSSAPFGARSAPDRALDRVLGHVRRQRLVDAGTQPRVRRRVATIARRDCDFPDQFGEYLAAPGVSAFLRPSILGPLPIRIPAF
jgi:hypothetical protein